MDVTDPRVINTLFPFHFFLNSDLQIISKGTSLVKLLPDSIRFPDCFDVVRPGLGLELSFASIASFASNIFILRLKKGKSGITLKGQFVVCPNRLNLLFCGSPWLVSETSFRESGLMISDFAIHDSLIDLLHHFKAQQMAMEDIKDLNRQLVEKNALLEQFNRDFDLSSSDEVKSEGNVSTQRKSSYDNFLQKYQELQLKVTQFAAVELQLNSIRARLDDELEMYKRLQNFSTQALRIQTKRELVMLISEMVVDIFETEGSLVMLDQFGENTFSILKSEGLSFEEMQEEKLQECTRNLSYSIQRLSSPIVSHEQLKQHASFLKFKESLWFYYRNEDLGFDLHVAGLISIERGGLYSPLLERHATIFSVFAQQAVSILSNLHRELTIKRQLESEQTAVEEMKSLNKQLVDYNQALVKLNRDLDQFVYSASHDLRAPVLAISGIVEKIRTTEPSLANQVDDLHRIQQVASRMDDTITDIVGYSKNARLPIEVVPINLEALVRELFDSLKYLKNYDIALSVEIKTSHGFYGDKSRIQSLLRNLLSNAIKFSVSRPEGSFVMVSGRVDEHLCELEIADNGEGIPAEYQSKVFDMFFRASTNAHGSGLGLYICNEILQRLGGKIMFHSEPGEGTIFKISLPNRASAD